MRGPPHRRCTRHRCVGAALAAEAASEGSTAPAAMTGQERQRLVCGYDYTTVFLTAGYCLTSSLLSIINKFAVLHFPYPAALTGLQYLSSAAAVYLFGMFGFIDRVDRLQWPLVKQMAPVVFTFFASVFSNMKVLQNANVETFIVFRSVTPIVVAVADAIFRPYAATMPSPRTAATLLLIFAGAVGYVIVDSSFSMQSYTWGSIYVCVFCLEMIWVKDITSHIKLSNWGLVFYNNFLSFLLSVCIAILTNEGHVTSHFLPATAHAGAVLPLPTPVQRVDAAADANSAHHRRFLFEAAAHAVIAAAAASAGATPAAHFIGVAGDGAHQAHLGGPDMPITVITDEQPVVAREGEKDWEADTGEYADDRDRDVAAEGILSASERVVAFVGVCISCLFGLGISFFGFSVRRRISATGFTVMGCTNKLLTLFVNMVVWTRHASLAGQGCVLISIFGGVMYSEYAKQDADAKKAAKARQEVEQVTEGAETRAQDTSRSGVDNSPAADPSKQKEEK